jgi:hypothetical protein
MPIRTVISGRRDQIGYIIESNEMIRFMFQGQEGYVQAGVWFRQFVDGLRIAKSKEKYRVMFVCSCLLSRHVQHRGIGV